TYFDNGLFENAVGGRVGDHQCRQVICMRLSFSPEIGHIDVTTFIALHHDHRHARHAGGCRVGAVGRCRNEHDVAMPITAAFVVGTDHHQAGLLALCTRVGLEAYLGESRNLTEPVVQFTAELHVATHLVGRGEGVDV